MSVPSGASFSYRLVIARERGGSAGIPRTLLINREPLGNVWFLFWFLPMCCELRAWLSFMSFFFNSVCTTLSRCCIFYIICICYLTKKRVRETSMTVSWPGLVSFFLRKVQIWVFYMEQECVGLRGSSQASSLNSVQSTCVYGNILSSRAWWGTRVSLAL